MRASYKRISVTDSRIGWFALEQARKAKKQNTHYIIHCPTQSHRLELFTVGWLQNKSVKWVRAFKSVSSEFYLPWPKILHLSGVEPCDLHDMKGKTKQINKQNKSSLLRFCIRGKIQHGKTRQKQEVMQGELSPDGQCVTHEYTR